MQDSQHCQHCWCLPPPWGSQRHAASRHTPHANRSPVKRTHNRLFSCQLISVLCLVLLQAVSGSNQPLSGSGLASDRQDTHRLPEPVLAPGGLTSEHAKRVYSFITRARAEGSVWTSLPLANEADTETPKVADTGSPSQVNMMKLVDCVNQHYIPKNMTWATAMADDPASVKVVGSWWTTKQRRVPLTVVTQSTVDRIPQLYSQCKSWRGPVSVVLYQALVQPTPGALTAENEEIMKNALLHVSGFFEEVERDPEACMPDILLVYEVYTERRATLLYPINLLRNMARLQARTPMLALVDVDMLISSALYTDLLNPSTQQAMVQTTQAKSVYVLPAFETYGATHEAAALADTLVSQDKDLLIKAVEKGMAAPFDSKRFIFGHNSTNFPKWYASDTDYKITYGERYEPWVIVDRHNVPWHDVRFRGYGNNKIQQIAHINASRFTFIVHHGAFIIHRAHKETIMRHWLISSKMAFDNARARNLPVDRSSVYGHTRTLFDNAKELMNKGQFQAVLDPTTTGCHAILPWWRLVSGGQQRIVSRRRAGARRALSRTHGARKPL